MSQNTSDNTVSDALLDAQQNQNLRDRQSLKRFGSVMVILSLGLCLFLPYRLAFGLFALFFGIGTIIYLPILSLTYGLIGSPLQLIFKLLLAASFYLFICPIAYVLKGLNIDLMQQNYQPKADSYWISRTALLPHGKYMTSQR
jgi:hypothetical protein